MKSRIHTLDIQSYKDMYECFQTILREIYTLKTNQDKVLSEKQVLEMLGIGEKTMRSYRAHGLISYSKIFNKFFYRLSDINVMMNNARIEAENN